MSNNNNSNSNLGRNVGIAAGAAVLGGALAGIYYLATNTDVFEGPQPDQRRQNHQRPPNPGPAPQNVQRRSSEDAQRPGKFERHPSQNAQSTSSFRRAPFPRESETICVLCNEETKRENRLILKCNHIMHTQCYSNVIQGHGAVCPNAECQSLDL